MKVYIDLLDLNCEVYPRIVEILKARGHIITDIVEEAKALVLFVCCMESVVTKDLPLIIIGDFTIPQTVPQRACLIDINTGEVVNYNSVIAA